MTFIPAVQDPILIEHVTAISQREAPPAHISWVNMSWIQVTVEASIRHRAVQNRGWMNGTLRAEQSTKTAFKSCWKWKNRNCSLSAKDILPLFITMKEKMAPLCSCVHRFSFGKFWPTFAKLHMNFTLLECTSKPYFIFSTSSNNNMAGVRNV
jgi:hypothetical protein